MEGGGVLTPVAEVRTALRNCPIYVEWGCLSQLGNLMRQGGLAGKAVVVSDSTVHPLYDQAARAALEGAGFAALSLVVPAGEGSKTLKVAEQIYDLLVEHRLERQDSLVALGGGMVGDLTGFVAATFLRGLPWVAVPTSLVGMVDASIGGKVAVNHPRGKNLIGAFYQPHFVLADVSTLASLPPRELTSGWAEVIKHALTLDPEMLALLEEEGERLRRLEPEAAQRAVARSAATKAGVVSQDEREETGLRTVLNYGHTIGHGLEAATGYQRFLHGEAVAIGMMAAARLSHRLGLLGEELVARHRRLLEAFSLPTSCSGVDREAVLAALEVDKKSQAQAVRWVLLTAIGETVVRSVPLSEVRAVLQELIAG